MIIKYKVVTHPRDVWSEAAWQRVLATLPEGSTVVRHQDPDCPRGQALVLASDRPVVFPPQPLDSPEWDEDDFRFGWK